MRSLRGRLRARVLGVSALVFVVAATAAYLGVRSLLYAQFDRALTAKATSLATLVKYRGGGAIDFDFADEFMPEFERAEDPEFFSLWRADGRILERSRSARGRAFEPPDATWDTASCRDVALPDGRPGRAIVLRFLAQLDTADRPPTPAGRAEGRGRLVDAAGPDAAAPDADERRRVTLVVARGIDDISRPLAAFLVGLLAVGAAMVGGAAAAIELAVRRGLRPVVDLRDEVERIDASRLGTRVPVEPLVAELWPIGRTLNDLLARLQAAFERQGRFTSSAAHELRNPIAELRAVCEVALREPAIEPGSRRALEEALAVAGHMERIVSALLGLARADGDPGAPPAAESAPVRAIIREVFGPLEEKATARGLSCALDLPGDAVVRTDPALLRVILANVLENAVEYTPDGGRIRLACATDASTVTIEVANTSPLRDPALLPRVFEPFWRRDPGTGAASHAGLGLPLAQRLAQSLGGSLEADLTSGGDLVMTLRLEKGSSTFVKTTTSPSPSVSFVSKIRVSSSNGAACGCGCTGGRLLPPPPQPTETMAATTASPNGRLSRRMGTPSLEWPWRPRAPSFGARRGRRGHCRRAAEEAALPPDYPAKRKRGAAVGPAPVRCVERSTSRSRPRARRPWTRPSPPAGSAPPARASSPSSTARGPGRR